MYVTRRDLHATLPSSLWPLRFWNHEQDETTGHRETREPPGIRDEGGIPRDPEGEMRELDQESRRFDRRSETECGAVRATKAQNVVESRGATPCSLSLSLASSFYFSLTLQRDAELQGGGCGGERLGDERGLRRFLWDSHRACSGLLRTSAPVTHPRAHRMGKARVSCERKQVASSSVVSIPHDFLDLDESFSLFFPRSSQFLETGILQCKVAQQFN